MDSLCPKLAVGGGGVSAQQNRLTRVEKPSKTKTFSETQANQSRLCKALGAPGLGTTENPKSMAQTEEKGATGLMCRRIAVVMGDRHASAKHPRCLEPTNSQAWGPFQPSVSPSPPSSKKNATPAATESLITGDNKQR